MEVNYVVNHVVNQVTTRAANSTGAPCANASFRHLDGERKTCETALLSTPQRTRALVAKRIL